MKNIGLIGGVGWPSTIDYYRIINEEANRHFSDLTSPNVLVYSLNFQPFMELQYANKWKESAEVLSKTAQSLQMAGANMIAICSVTTNVVADLVQKSINIPIVSIVDSVSEAVKKKNLKKVALFGTKVTMEYPFFAPQMKKQGIECVVPIEKERQVIHDVIYNELCINRINRDSKSRYIEIAEKLFSQGVEGLILGCTEIPMLISQRDFEKPVFEVTKLHALKAFRDAIS